MLLEVFHAGPVSDVHCEDLPRAISHEELSLPIVEDDIAELMGAESSVDTDQLSRLCIPDLERVRVEGRDAEESGIEDDLEAGLLVSEELVLGLIVFEVAQLLPSADDPLLHRLRAVGRVGEREGCQLIERSVEGLHTEEVAHVPDLNHP